MVFTLVFAVALARLDEARRAPVVGFFNGVCDALLIVIGWVLFLAPLGVFALAFVAGAASGNGLFGALLHFILLYVAVGAGSLALGYAIALLAAGFALPAFAKAMAPTQAIAFSTQSSTGSLPAMLVSARSLEVRERTMDIVLPMAAALFRVDGPGNEHCSRHFRRQHAWHAFSAEPMQPALPLHRSHRSRPQGSGAGQLLHVDCPDFNGDGRADRSARDADRGRAGARHVPNGGQCDDGRRGHRSGRQARPPHRRILNAR